VWASATGQVLSTIIRSDCALLQDIQAQRAAHLGSHHPQLAVVHAVKSMALLQLGDKQRAQQELLAAQQMLEALRVQQPEDKQDGQKQVEQLCGRISAHLEPSS